MASPDLDPRARSRVLTTLVVLTLLLLALSGWRPYDRLTWLMEVMPVLIGLPLLWLTRQRYPLTLLACTLLFLHAVVLMIGGMHTYARVPLGDVVQHWLGLHRNPYDKLGHFMQGFVPALVAREILLRGRFVRRPGMLAFLVVCVALAISATYELIEWGAALVMGQDADAFLGTQGDVWDTQSDMFMALVGALAALLLLPREHDRQIAALPPWPGGR